VYWTEGGHAAHAEDPGHWSRVYSAVHAPSNELVELVLDDPIIVKAGVLLGLYVHSTLPGDEGIVYDNQRGTVTHDDKFIRVKPGRAHISPLPFSARGYWGWGWRPNREFVGRVNYGVRYKLWNPVRDVHNSFPVSFQRGVQTLFLCAGRDSSPLARLPPEVVLYILNMCPWQW
jgi:hypothetical protein